MNEGSWGTVPRAFSSPSVSGSPWPQLTPQAVQQTWQEMMQCLGIVPYIPPSLLAWEPRIPSLLYQEPFSSSEGLPSYPRGSSTQFSQQSLFSSLEECQGQL